MYETLDTTKETLEENTSSQLKEVQELNTNIRLLSSQVEHSKVSDTENQQSVGELTNKVAEMNRLAQEATDHEPSSNDSITTRGRKLKSWNENSRP